MLGEQIRPTTYSVRDLLDFKKSGVLKLSPNFQRNPIWRKSAKSYLIDTIVRGYPIPAILVREKSSDEDIMKTIREVVDGQQRIRTVLSFIDPRVLEDYRATDEFTVSRIHNKDIAGKAFSDLSGGTKKKILDYIFNVSVLPANTSDKEILEIFSRINSTGVSLNYQELRNAKYQGSFKTTIFELATEQYNNWLNWGVFSENDIARMRDSELVSEMAEFILSGKIQGKKQKSLDKLYKTRDDTFEEKQKISRAIRNIIDIIGKVFGEDLKNSVFRTKGFFFLLFVFVYRLEKEKRTNISKLRKLLFDIDDKIKNGQLGDIFESRRNTTLDVQKKVVDYLIKCFANE